MYACDHTHAHIHTRTSMFTLKHTHTKTVTQFLNHFCSFPGILDNNIHTAAGAQIFPTDTHTCMHTQKLLYNKYCTVLRYWNPYMWDTNERLLMREQKKGAICKLTDWEWGHDSRLGLDLQHRRHLLWVQESPWCPEKSQKHQREMWHIGLHDVTMVFTLQLVKFKHGCHIHCEEDVGSNSFRYKVSNKSSN